jgi:penicillin-insensitive murein endopeptidase
MLLRWAIALGESTEVLYRADAVMAQPRRGAGVHDDHIHVRSACTRSEVAAGCSPAAPRRPWLDDDAPEADSSEELAALLFQPLPPTADAKPIAP